MQPGGSIRIKVYSMSVLALSLAPDITQQLKSIKTPNINKFLRCIYIRLI